MGGRARRGARRLRAADDLARQRAPELLRPVHDPADHRPRAAAVRGPGRAPRRGASSACSRRTRSSSARRCCCSPSLGMPLFALSYALARRDVARAARAAAGQGARRTRSGSAWCCIAYPLYWQFAGRAELPQRAARRQRGQFSRSRCVEFAGRSLLGDDATADKLALNRTEQNAFYGWPLVALAFALVVRLWRRPRGQGAGVHGSWRPRSSRSARRSASRTRTWSCPAPGSCSPTSRSSSR